MNSSYLITTVGKLFFNEIFPYDFPYINEPAKNNLVADQIRFFAPKGTNIREFINDQPLKNLLIKSSLKKLLTKSLNVTAQVKLVRF